MGWYRMSQHVFTTRHIYLGETEVYEVLWARIDLQSWQPTDRHKRLLKQAQRFSISLHPATISPAIEKLYTQYRSAISFDASASVAAYLLEQQLENFFPTLMWQVHDGNELIAASYFDEGLSSAAGILTFFKPQYKKFSLGLLLYLESVRHAAASGKRYFYPGYIALNNPKFDYKLLAGKAYVEIWEFDSMKWIPYSQSRHAAS
jgi:arginine-tRNA-protein transferase